MRLDAWELDPRAFDRSDSALTSMLQAGLERRIFQGLPDRRGCGIGLHEVHGDGCDLAGLSPLPRRVKYPAARSRSSIVVGVDLYVPDP